MHKRVQDVAKAVYENSEHQLQESRYSFATAPSRILELYLKPLFLAAAGADENTLIEDLAYGTIALGTSYLLLVTTELIASLYLSYQVGAYAAFHLLQRSQGRVAADDAEDVQQAAGLMLAMVQTMTVLLIAVVPDGLFSTRFIFTPIISLAIVFVTLLGAIVGWVLIVAWWKLMKGTYSRLYWPTKT